MDKEQKRENSLKNLKPFKPGRSGNPKGRPKNRVPDQLKIIMGKEKAKKFFSLSEVEINEWEAAILSMNIDQLKLLTKWEDCPMYPKGLAIAIATDAKNGTTKTLDKLRERQFGKAIQKVELTGKDGADFIPARVLSKEEAKEFIQNLEDEI